MPELLVDFITLLDGYGAAEGWPGWWGLQGPEYLGWLAESSERNYTILMGANTYRLMSSMGYGTILRPCISYPALRHYAAFRVTSY
jgi:hypothetical protein